MRIQKLKKILLTKKWCHYGFIQFSTDAEARLAYANLNGSKLRGRYMRIEFQRKKVSPWIIFHSNLKKIISFFLYNIGHLKVLSLNLHNHSWMFIFNRYRPAIENKIFYTIKPSFEETWRAVNFWITRIVNLKTFIIYQSCISGEVILV